MRKIISTLATAVALAAGLLLGAPSSASAATHPCPTYFGCVYSGTSSSGYWIFEQERYDTYPVYNWYGNHLAVNAQTGGAYMSGLDRNGHVLWTLQDGRSLPRSAVENMTPVYFIRLSPGPSCWPRCV